MSIPRYIIYGSIALFGIIGVMALGKKSKKEPVVETVQKQEIQIAGEKPLVIQQETPKELSEAVADDLPEVDQIHRFFTLGSNKFPIVETVRYTSRVPWLKGRPAWIADYASYFSTSRHFIARSLNRMPDYFTQKVSPGDRFNVLKREQDIEFYLLIDVSRCKMWFYYLDKGKNERVLVKTYPVGLGRKDNKRSSGLLTPLGHYTLGDKIAIYKPGVMGYYQDQKVEMIRIFGSRWIPFAEEVENCTEPAKGLGIHGTPFKENSPGSLEESTDLIGKYDSDGCIRLASQDMEELFSIVITRPTHVVLVNDFHDANLPGVEKKENQ